MYIILEIKLLVLSGVFKTSLGTQTVIISHSYDFGVLLNIKTY